MSNSGNAVMSAEDDLLSSGFGRLPIHPTNVGERHLEGLDDI